MMNKKGITRLFVALVALAAATASGQSWNNDPSSPIGPNYWGFLAGTIIPLRTAGRSWARARC